MLKIRWLLVLSTLILFQIYSSGQGLNNNYEIDLEDIKNIFERQGIQIFKFPFSLKAGEYISISYEIYENGELADTNYIIEDFEIDEGIKMNYHISKVDTTVFYRFYFYENNDTLEMREFLPGLQSVQYIDLSKVEIGSFNSISNISDSLLEKQELLYYYGLFKGGEKFEQNNGWLGCTTGLPKEMVIDRNDFVIFFYAERITEEKAKTILEEIKDKRS